MTKLKEMWLAIVMNKDNPALSEVRTAGTRISACNNLEDLWDEARATSEEDDYDFVVAKAVMRKKRIVVSEDFE